MLESIVVFAEILGFRKIIKKAYKQTNQDALLKRLSAAVDSTYQYLEDSHDYSAKKVRL